MKSRDRLIPLVFLALLFCGSPLFAQTGTIQFSSATYSATGSTSGTVNATITLTRTGGSVGSASVAYCAFIGNDSTTTLYDQSDYRDIDNLGSAGQMAFLANVATWANGDTAPKTFTIPLAQRNPAVKNGSSVIQLALEDVQGASRGAVAAATLTINDPAPPTAGVLKFSRRVFFGDRPGGLATITVSRSGGSTGSVSVNYSTTNNNNIVTTNSQGTTNSTVPPWSYIYYNDANPGPTRPPAATVGTDYTATSGTLTWAAGDMADKTFTIPLNTSASGTNEVIGVTLSSPTGGAVLGNAALASCVITDSAKSLVSLYHQGAGEEMRLWLPPPGVPLRGILFYLPGSGNDTRGACNDFAWQQAAQALGFGILGTNGNLLSGGPYGIGSFRGALKMAADFSGRPEVANAPIFSAGFSAGGFASVEASTSILDRVIGFFAFRASEWSDGRQINGAQKAVPGFYAVGDRDSTVEPGWANLSFVSRRAVGEQVAYAVDWGTGHAAFGAGSSEPLMWSYLSELIPPRFPTTGQTLPGPNPGQTVALQPIANASGYLNPHDYTFTTTGPDGLINGGYQTLPPYTAESAYSGNKTTANWLPSATFARAFQAFNARQVPVGGGNTNLANAPLNTPLKFTAPARLASLVLGQTYPVEINPRRVTNLKKIRFYEGDTLLGERSAAPWKINWTPAVGGVRTLTAIGTDANGQDIPAFTTVSVQTGTSPGFVQFQDSAPEAYRSAGNATLVINRSGGKAGAVSATWTITGGTAVSGTDFSGPNSGTVSWADGDATPKTISIPLLNSTPRLARTLTLTLSNPTGGLQLPPARDNTDGAPPDTRRESTTATLYDDLTPLPSPWSTTTVGSTIGSGIPGEASLYAENIFSLRAATNENYGSTDCFRYVMQPMTGNCTITARVVSMTSGGSFPRAGVMIRQDLSATSPFCASQAQPTNSSIMLYRTTGGGGTANTAGTSLTVPNAWFRVTRVGNVFTSYTSPDGSTWTQVGSPQTITMTGTVYVGLVWANNSGGALSTEARFDNVAVTGTAVATAAPVITGTPLAPLTGYAGEFLSRTLTATGNPLPTFSIASGTLPAGLTLNPVTGILSGVSQNTTSTSVTIRATNALGTNDSTLSITLSLLVPPVISTGAFPTTPQSQPVSYQLAATNSPTSWAMTGGSLPAGVSFNAATATISGTPSQTGNFRPVFTATNSAGTSAPKTVAMNIVSALSPSVVYEFNSTQADFNDRFLETQAGGSPTWASAGITATGGVGNTGYLATSSNTQTALWNQAFTWLPGQTSTVSLFFKARVNTGSPPVAGTSPAGGAGMRLGFADDNLGTLSGAEYLAVGINTTSGDQSQLAVISRQSSTTTANGPNVGTLVHGNWYELIGTFTKSATSGRFDVIVSLKSWGSDGQTGGTVLGTSSSIPVTSLTNVYDSTGVYAGFVGTTNSNSGVLGLDRFSAAIPVSPPVVAPGQMFSGPPGVSFNQSVTATGNPLSFALVSGSLPAGLSLNTTTGAITGTPSVSGVFTPMISATNLGGGESAAVAVGITILSGLDTFRTANGLAADGSQDLLTPAGDGIANLLKYAFNLLGNGPGQTPTLSTPNPALLASDGSAGLPLLGVNGFGQLQITFIRRKASTGSGITYSVEFSDALATWAVNPSATEGVTSLDATFERVTVTDSLAAPAKRFARVKVTAP